MPIIEQIIIICNKQYHLDSHYHIEKDLILVIHAITSHTG